LYNFFNYLPYTTPLRIEIFIVKTITY